MVNIEQIEEEITRKSLLNHPFYKMWSQGELTLSQLSGYAKEYFQLVKIVPDLVIEIGLKTSDANAKMIVAEHMKEEREHIELWIRFASALGVPRSELTNFVGSDKTNKAVSELVDIMKNSSFEEAVSAMYAYEWELPRISRSKLDGLVKFYGLTSVDATIYFDTHLVADVRHAATLRGFLINQNERSGHDMLQAARKSIEAQNVLLDSVLESYVLAVN